MLTHDLAKQSYPSTWHGRRNRTSLARALQKGLKVSELIILACGDVVLGTDAHAWQEADLDDDAYRSIPPLQ